jgi:transposase-like protein
VRNVLEKVPHEVQPLLKPYLEVIRDAPDIERGRRLVAEVVERFGRQYPSAMGSLQEDLETSLAHLRLPSAQRKHVRTTNRAEGSFEEKRRRARVLPRFRSERQCLKLVFAVLWRASERWRRVQFSEHERRQLQRYLEERQRQRAASKEAPVATVA